MKILNLYCGIGGNRKLWENCSVTAVEYNPEIAAAYKLFFPNDNVIIEDAHEYLLKNYQDFDFIWASPPCQSHSSFRQNINVRYRGTPAIYPDMKLYQEIIFLKHNFKGKWVVENVKPYYQALIEPDFILQRHFFWGNIKPPIIEFEKDMIRSAQIPDLQKKHGFDLTGIKLPNKRQVLRNCVTPEVGKYIFDYIRAMEGEFLEQYSNVI